ncbi:hypothetical protein ANANG_G00039670 [Anguilla anguilla]|uniref:EF-hand domain-containing protein n=1 Tax=Anguilla anguilla TaxID=7936 RepID=A0A9D3MTH0_ANGAN|nr:hypothetical protein ANANG_G00039670 [Anguilla anguilla]
MDQFLLSSPGGHADWELEQKPSLGFLVLDPDKVAALPKGSKESLESGLDFRETGKELVSLNLDEILQENALNLDNLLRNSRYSDADRIMSWNESGASPQGVSEEPSLLSHHEESSRSQVSQGGETLSSETEDKGLFLELVRDPLTVSNAILEGSPESHPSSPSHTCSSAAYSQTLNVQEGSRLIQNGASNDISGSLSFEDHALHTSEEGCLSSHVDDTAENIPVDTLTFSLPLKQCCEGDFCLPGHQRYLEEPEACASCPDGDAAHQDELLRGQGSDGALSVDLMEEKVFLGSARQEEHKELIGSSSPTADAMHDKETPDPKPPESTLQEGLPGLELNGRSGEAELDLDAVLHTQDCPEDLALELDGLPSGNLWMTEETAEGLLLSEVGASNSLPMGGSVSEGVDDLSSLKAVFNALDQDSDGFVRIEEFLQFATAYGAEQVKDLTGFLDPSGLGVISFEDFYRGIAAISNGGPDPRLCDVGFSLGRKRGSPGSTTTTPPSSVYFTLYALEQNITAGLFFLALMRNAIAGDASRDTHGDGRAFLRARAEYRRAARPPRLAPPRGN